MDLHSVNSVDLIWYRARRSCDRKVCERASEGKPDEMKDFEILRHLKFPETDTRERMIDDKAAGTFEWLLGSQQANRKEMTDQEQSVNEELDPNLDDTRARTSTQFQHFLHWEDAKFIIFSLSGAGKSTFMKFLANNALVRDKLQSWGHRRHLVVSKFLFSVV
ncbi:hypothetical protein EDB80DRAFT_869535 [Ilyonectria destructans]|nr:hypothetical protein EDB80DRAFT_869535 [Ilyonectria destructans]